MPKKLEDCVAKVKARNSSNVNPWAVCVSSTGLKPHKGDGRKSGSKSGGKK